LNQLPLNTSKEINSALNLPLPITGPIMAERDGKWDCLKSKTEIWMVLYKAARTKAKGLMIVLMDPKSQRH
jgi:hypothetical protein